MTRSFQNVFVLFVLFPFLASICLRVTIWMIYYSFILIVIWSFTPDPRIRLYTPAPRILLYTLLSVYFRIIRFIKSFFIFILWAVFFSFQSPRLPHTVWTSFDKIFSKCIYIIWYKCNRRYQKSITIFLIYGLEINSLKSKL